MAWHVLGHGHGEAPRISCTPTARPRGRHPTLFSRQVLRGDEEEKQHLLKLDNFPEKYVCRDEKIRPRWEHIGNGKQVQWIIADS